MRTLSNSLLLRSPPWNVIGCVCRHASTVTSSAGETTTGLSAPRVVAQSAQRAVAAKQQRGSLQLRRPGGTLREQLLDLVASGSRLFRPRKLPPILVLATRLPEAEREIPELREYLNVARTSLEESGGPARALGVTGAVAVVIGARRLQMPEGTALAASVLSALAAEAPQLQPQVLAELTQELVRQRCGDRELWLALANATVAARELGGAPLVALLDAFRRGMSIGPRVDAVFSQLSRCAAEGAKDLTSKQIVGAVGSLSRLGGHIAPSDQRKAIQILLDSWLSRQDPCLRGTPSSQVISLAVSLTNLSETLGVRPGAFVDAAATWARGWILESSSQPRPEASAPAGASMSGEDLMVLLWALKELTPLGLGPHRDLLSAALPHVRAEWKPEAYSLLRLIQASEVLLASRPALGTLDEVLTDLVVDALANAISKGCPPDMLTRVVALWDQLGKMFWCKVSTAGLAEAVVAAAVEHLEDPRLRASTLHSLLDTLVESSFSHAPAFAESRRVLHAVASARSDSTEPGLAGAIESLAAHGEADEAEAAGSGTSDSWPEQAPSSSSSSPAPLPRPSQQLGPAALAEELGALCKQGAPETDIAIACEELLVILDRLAPDEVVPALQDVLSGARRRLARVPVLLDVVERLGDLVVAYADDLSVLQLTAALNQFAAAGLPYHLLFETVLTVVAEREQVQGISWGQVIGVLEAFAAVRLRIPELRLMYDHLWRPQELARLPTMALVRFISAAARLELVGDRTAEVVEIVDRVLAETTPLRPLPLESSVVLVHSLLLSGTILMDRQLRHLLAWVAGARVQQLTPQQLTVLRQYSLFILAQPDAQARSSLLRLPIEVQRFVSGILRHRAPSWAPAVSDTGKQFRGQVLELMVESGLGCTPSLSLGPVGAVDVHTPERCWLLDGPEAFFRPFSGELRHTPQERRRAWLLDRLLTDKDARGCVADFFPAAASWPSSGALHRLSWLEWGRASPARRHELLRLDSKRTS